MSGSDKPNIARVRAAALDPMKPYLVQPWKSLVEQGYVTALSCNFTQFGVEVMATPSMFLAATPGFQLKAGVPAAPSHVLDAARKNNLLGRRAGLNPKGPAKQAGPSRSDKSLTKEDWDLDDPAFNTRVHTVMKTLGAKMLGRVRSRKMFGGTLTTPFLEWWEDATAEQRLSALADGRFLPDIMALGSDKIARLRQDEINISSVDSEQFKTLEFRVAIPPKEEDAQQAKP